MKILNNLFLVVVLGVTQLAVAVGYTNINSRAQFDKALKSSTPSVFMFSTPTCSPCQATKPHFSEAAGRWHNIKFYVVDLSKASLKPLIDKFNIGGVPTIVYTHHGKEVKRDRRGGMTRNEVFEAVKDFEKSINKPAKKVAKVDSKPKKTAKLKK